MSTEKQEETERTMLQRLQDFYNDEEDEEGPAIIRIEEINDRLVYHFQNKLHGDGPGDPTMIAIPKHLTMGEFALFEEPQDVQREEPCMRVMSRTCYVNPKTEKKGFDRSWLSRLSVSDGRAATDIFRVMVAECVGEGPKKKKPSQSQPS